MSIILKISAQLEVILIRMNVSKRDLAKRLGQSPGNISKKFKLNNWREDDVREICDALGIDYHVTFTYKNGDHII